MRCVLTKLTVNSHLLKLAPRHYGRFGTSCFTFFRSCSKSWIILGISFLAQAKQICCRDKGYAKYFSPRLISFLQETHFFILYGSVFLVITYRNYEELV